MTDTKPRCGGTPGKPGVLQDPYLRRGPNNYACPGCPDCQPAPTPSGDDARPDAGSAIARAVSLIGLLRSCILSGEPLYEADHMAIAATLDELPRVPAALQEARERLTAAGSLSRKGHRALAAAEAWNVEAERVLKEERERRKVAEERLQEVEGERDRLLDAAEALIAVDARSYRHDLAGEAQRARDLDVAFTNLRAAATPSTDEEGRR